MPGEKIAAMVFSGHAWMWVRGAGGGGSGACEKDLALIEIKKAIRAVARRIILRFRGRRERVGGAWRPRRRKQCEGTVRSAQERRLVSRIAGDKTVTEVAAILHSN